MRSRPWLAVALVAVAGAVGLLAFALATTTSAAFTIGVLSSTPGPPVRPGATACQQPIRVPPGGEFDAVDFEIGNYHRAAGPTVDVVVRPLERGLPVRRGVLPAGYPDVGVQQRHVVRVGRVPAGTLIAVCFRNRGPGRVALFGGPDAATKPSTGTIDRAPTGFDFDLVFRAKERSFAQLAGQIASRATLFRPPWLSPGVLYALLGLLLVGAPLLLAKAARGLDP